MISSKVVTKLDGTAPTPAAISKAASEFGSEKKKRGRKPGQNKTTKAEDRAILKTFHKLRPPGKGCPSSHALLPQATMHNSLVNVFQGRACLSFACSWSLACSLRNSLSFLVGSVMWHHVWKSFHHRSNVRPRQQLHDAPMCFPCPSSLVCSSACPDVPWQEHMLTATIFTDTCLQRSKRKWRGVL